MYKPSEVLHKVEVTNDRQRSLIGDMSRRTWVRIPPLQQKDIPIDSIGRLNVPSGITSELLTAMVVELLGINNQQHTQVRRSN